MSSSTPVRFVRIVETRMDVPAPPSLELREDGSFELREDNSVEVRELP